MMEYPCPPFELMRYPPIGASSKAFAKVCRYYGSGGKAKELAALEREKGGTSRVRKDEYL